MLILFLASLTLLSFLLLLDLNELRQNNIEYASISSILDENSIVVERIDSTVKPYLKKFLKIVQYKTNISYEYNKDKFQDMTTLQVLNDFTTTMNITSSSDFFTLFRDFAYKDKQNETITNYGENTEEISETGYKTILDIWEKLSKLIIDLFDEKHTMEINTTKVYEII